KQAVKESESVLLATDPDREGEAISWHLAQNLSLENDKNRIVFNEISSKAVKQAIGSAREINMRLVDAQQARRVLDRLVGYKVSPILSRKIKSGLSGGRVQSAALKMVVDREREINAFTPEEYWHLTASLTKDESRAKEFKALLADQKGKKIKITSKDESDKVVSELDGASWTVDSVKRGLSKSRPAPPFMTSTLQQDGVQKLGFTAPQVMQLAQQLYEGIDILGEGQTAFVTYIRTDSVRVAADMQQETLRYIRENYGEEYAPKKPNYYTTKSQNMQDAHEAIRPISLERTPESVKDKLPRNLFRLYKLIYDRYIASQMTDAEYNTLTVRVQADTVSGTNYGFKLSGKTLLFKGYTTVYENEKKSDDESSGNLPDLHEGEPLRFKGLNAEQKFTKPPSRYTDSTLVKAMEQNGIGRPSTYASVIGVLSKREYTVKEQKLIKPTALGETVTEFMESFFSNIVDTGFTADMENKLDKIEQGAKWQKIIADFYPGFSADVIKAQTNDKKMQVPVVVSDVICEKCGANMVYKDGRYGKFLACPNYPRCRNVKSIAELVGVCPQCGGSITKCYSKAGKIFYGCSNYPKCKFMSWKIPAPIFCPKCSGTMHISETGSKERYVCINHACRHTILVNEDKN
ncbi:MAG: type I DNA topoisomerase, partial [Clostridia bacterium]